MGFFFNPFALNMEFNIILLVVLPWSYHRLWNFAENVEIEFNLLNTSIQKYIDLITKQ